MSAIIKLKKTLNKQAVRRFFSREALLIYLIVLGFVLGIFSASAFASEPTKPKAITKFTLERTPEFKRRPATTTTTTTLPPTTTTTIPVVQKPRPVQPTTTRPYVAPVTTMPIVQAETIEQPVVAQSSQYWLQVLRTCETHSNYQTNTGNGYFGAYQFSYRTWQSMGTGYERADLAPPEVQDDAALRLVARAGSHSQFPGCTRSKGIPNKF